MSNFRVGQKVVIVSPGSLDPTPVGTIVTLIATYTCPCCGDKAVAFKPSVKLYACSRLHASPVGYDWWHASKFRPIQEQSVSAKLTEELLERIIEERPEHINEPIEA